MYTLRGATHVFAYTFYVACTPHVRNAAGYEGTNGGKYTSLVRSSLQVLNELNTHSTGVSKAAKIVKNLMIANGLSLVPDKSWPPFGPLAYRLSHVENSQLEQRFADYDS